VFPGLDPITPKAMYEDNTVLSVSKYPAYERDSAQEQNALCIRVIRVR
jgi:hypothetical protein